MKNNQNIQVSAHNENVSARVQSAARRFAMVGALGLASLITPTEALAQNVSRPVSSESSTQTQQGHTPADLVNTLNEAHGGAQNLFNQDVIQTLAENWVKVYEIREILIQGQPAANSPSRSVYDRAMQFYGTQDAAVAAVTAVAIDGLHRIAIGAHISSDLGPSLNTVISALGKIDAGVGSGDANYAAFDRGSDIACVRRMARGGDACTEDGVPRPQDPLNTRPELPLIELQPMLPGSLTLLNGTGGPQYTFVNGFTTTVLNSLFGGQGNAQSAVNAYGNALATLANSPTDQAKQAQAAQNLFNALNQIPHGRELWSRPQFNAAMQALSHGDLRGGLSHLSQETSLNVLFQNQIVLHQLNLSQRAVARLHTGLIFRFPERDNIAGFNDYRRGAIDSAFEWKVLHFDLGANYTNLAVSASDTVYLFNPLANTMTPVSSPIRIVGEGNAIDATAGVTWGGSMFHQPTESTLSGRLGYLWWNLNHGFIINGQRQQLDVNGGQPFGELRFNVDLVGYEGRTWPFRLDRVGLGIYNLNPYLYFTLAERWHEGNNLRVETSLTPEYMLFWGTQAQAGATESFFQNRISGDLRLIDFSVQTSGNHTLFFGPGFWYSYNFAQGIHTMEPYFHAAWRFARGVTADARVGYIFDVGGEESFHIPTSLTGSFNLILSPSLWFNSNAHVSGVSSRESNVGSNGRSASNNGEGPLVTTW